MEGRPLLLHEVESQIFSSWQESLKDSHGNSDVYQQNLF